MAGGNFDVDTIAQFPSFSEALGVALRPLSLMASDHQAHLRESEPAAKAIA